MEQDLPSEQPIETTYHLVLKGTIRGNTKLVTNTGYTFNIRKRLPNGTIDWQCTVRGKDHRCKASALAFYMEENWITSTMWPQSCWSVFMLPIRTNNDIEAWHHGLNSRANNRVHLPFYLLVELLHQEARLVSIQIRLVSDGKLSRIQRKKYRLLQSKIFKH